MGRAQKRRNRSQIKYLEKLTQDNSVIFRQELTKRLEGWDFAVRKKATRACPAR